MSIQNYNNHIRFYPPHHFVYYPVVSTGLGISLYYAVQTPELRTIWLAVSSLFFVLLALAFMLRQHYALNNQNRIVRLEMRFRYYVLTQKRFEQVESQLSFGQIAALRFASDEELPSLIQRALQEKLTSDQIKREIKNWLPDLMRA